MAARMAASEAFLAMVAMLIVLGFVLFFYCIWPIYRGYKKRRERERELYENDPRWDNVKFNFSPRIPENLLNDKKYSRAAACSRSSSMRSTAPMLPEDGAAQREEFCPPMYSELFETSSSLGTPPSYKSNPSSVLNSNSDLLPPTPPKIVVSAPPAKPAKTKKPKKKPPPASKPAQETQDASKE